MPDDDEDGPPTNAERAVRGSLHECTCGHGVIHHALGPTLHNRTHCLELGCTCLLYIPSDTRD
jgi:hypothetical protein